MGLDELLRSAARHDLQLQVSGRSRLAALMVMAEPSSEATAPSIRIGSAALAARNADHCIPVREDVAGGMARLRPNSPVREYVDWL